MDFYFILKRNIIWLARIHSMCQDICFHLFVAGYVLYFLVIVILKV
jgi:hypothetical protein